MAAPKVVVHVARNLVGDAVALICDHHLHLLLLVGDHFPQLNAHRVCLIHVPSTVAVNGGLHSMMGLTSGMWLHVLIHSMMGLFNNLLSGK